MKLSVSLGNKFSDRKESFLTKYYSIRSKLNIFSKNFLMFSFTQHSISPVKINGSIINIINPGEVFISFNTQILLIWLGRVFCYSKSTFIFYFYFKQYKPICSQCTLSLPTENIRKPYSFLMFSGGRERVHWEQKS